MRGRGLSADHSDQRPERHVQDMEAFIDSIGEPVGVVGWSTGGWYALGAAAHGAGVSALAIYESPVFQFWAEEEEDAQRFRESVAGMMEAVAEGRLTDAARAFHRAVSNDDEMTALEENGAFEYDGRYAPSLGRVIEQASETEAADPNDPSELAKVTVPVLLLHGSRTTVPHARSMQYLAELLPDARLREVPGVGHMAPALAPGRIAEELVSFFDASA